MAVFISYRREDSEGDVRAVYNRLVEGFGKSRVFLDVEGIDGGEQWLVKIKDTLDKAAATLVFIGPGWLRLLEERAASGRADYVREEIKAALEHPKSRVLPVLVQGARMPSAEELPEDIRALAGRNAAEIRATAWQDDVARLVRALRNGGALPVANRTWVLRGAAIAAAVLLVVAVYKYIYVPVPDLPEGMRYAEAEQHLASAGLKAAMASVATGDEQGTDFVREQSPQPGARVLRRSVVDITVEHRFPYGLVCNTGDLLAASRPESLVTIEKETLAKGDEKLRPGACAWTDRPMRMTERNRIKVAALSPLDRSKNERTKSLILVCAYSRTDNRYIVALRQQYFLDWDGQGWGPVRVNCNNS